MPHIIKDLLILITNLGDSGLLSVLSFMCALYLYATDNKRAAFVLSGALLGCIGIMGFLKIYFIGCHQQFQALNIESPSGHAAMGAAIYGTLAAIIARHFTGWRRALAPSLALPLMLAIAASRYLLEHHSLNEVLLGFSVGLLIAVTSYALLKDSPKNVFRVRYLALTSLAAVALLYGTRAPAETFIRSLALFLNDNLHFCA